MALTGAGSEVGVTTAVVGIGSTLGEDYSLKVALVDANFQSPALGNLARGWPGFADVIAGRVALEGAMLRTDHGRLSVLPAGRPGEGRPPLPDREGVERCLTGLRRRYDWVLFDTAPAADAAETTLLAAQVDSVALVVQAARSRDDEIAAAIDMIKGTSANFSGIIFNRVPARRSRWLRLRAKR
jgi:MinD-like ATPase involved in chromosome partitioning or flagellar assembly